MRKVDHLPVHAEGARAWIGLESGDDLARVLNFDFGRRISAVDDGDLIGMNRQASDETVAPGAAAIPFEALQIAKIRVERVDRRRVGGRGGEQALRARQFIGKRPRPVRLLVVGRAERRGKIFRAPGQGDQPRIRRRIGAEARTSLLLSPSRRSPV